MSASYKTINNTSMGKFAAYKVPLATLKPGHHEQEFDCGTEFFKNLEHPEILKSDVKAHMDLDSAGDVYTLRFTLKGTLQIPCDRCLDPLEHEVDTQYTLKVQYGEDYDDGTDNLLTIPYADTSLNVAYILADTVLLTIPLRHVHPMGKCNRAMASVLSRHTAGGSDEETTEEIDVDIPDTDTED